MSTTNAKVRNHFEGEDESDYRYADSPGNGADTVVAADARVHVVTADGTNTVDLDAAAVAGRGVTVVHNGGASTPTVEFADADFLGTGPSNLTSEGATATVVNTNGETDGWVVKATGSA